MSGSGPRDAPAAKGVDEQRVVGANPGAVIVPEGDDVGNQLLVAAPHDGGDGLLHLEADQRGGLVVDVGHAVHLGRGPSQLLEHLVQLLGLGQR